MRDLEEINRRLAEHQRARLEAARSQPPPRRKRKGHPCSPRTRERLSRSAFERQRAAALADPEINAAKAARLAAGLTIEVLAARALCGVSTIARLEAGQPISDISARRIARALNLPVSKVRDG